MSPRKPASHGDEQWTFTELHATGFGAAGVGLWGFSAMAGDDRGLGVLVVWLTIIV